MRGTNIFEKLFGIYTGYQDGCHLEDVLNSKEAGEYLDGMDAETIRMISLRGDGPRYEFENGRDLFFNKHELDAWNHWFLRRAFYGIARELAKETLEATDES